MTPHFRRAGAAAVVALLLAPPASARLGPGLPVVLWIPAEAPNQRPAAPVVDSALNVTGPGFTGFLAIAQASRWTATKPVAWTPSSIE